MFGRIGFRGYSQTDLVPEGEGAITLSPTNMNSMFVDYSKCTYLSWKKYFESPEIMVNPGDVLLVKTASVGKCSYVNELPQECTVNPQILVLKEHKDSPLFLTYLFQTAIGQTYIELNKVGSTIPTLSEDKIGKFSFAFPPISEQLSIVSFLNSKTKLIDDIIAKREKQIELLEEMKSAIISRAVTKGLNLEAKMKDSGIEWIGEVPEEWEISKVKYIANVCGRIGYRGYTTNDLVSAGEGALTIGGKHITHNYLNLSDSDYISWEKYYESPEIMLEKGDIVMAQRGSLGKSALIDREIGEATINPSLVILKRIKANGIFLHYYLISNMMQDYINLINTATAVPMISQNQIENTPIALPPLSEQQAIASYLDSETSKIDSRISKRRKQIELLQEYKQALITAAVTGKIDVRDYIS